LTTLTPDAEERWVGANGLRAKDKFVLAFHYRRPSEKTEGGQSIPIAQGWVGAETDGNHDVRRMIRARVCFLTRGADVAAHACCGR
jgi:hypothetical protein